MILLSGSEKPQDDGYEWQSGHDVNEQCTEYYECK